MNFAKFKILNSKTSQSQEYEEVEVLFNLDHIVSIKPIRISRPDRLMNGFWIRTLGGKKYRASTIPDELLHILGDKYQGGVVNTTDPDEQPFH